MPSHPVDVYVGNRLRARRVVLGMSQEAIGKAIGVTFQQIQKYERGINRMGASRLYEFGRLLNIPEQYFFEGFTDYQPANGEYKTVMAEEAEGFEHDTMTSRETLELVRAYYNIKDEKQRKRVMELLKSMGD